MIKKNFLGPMIEFHEGPDSKESGPYPMRVYIKSFGCRVNQYEGEQIRESFAKSSQAFTQDWRGANLCVINSCSVTDRADRDARILIRRIRKNNPAARIIVTGCYATRAHEEIHRLFPEALIVGNRQKELIPSLVGCSLGFGSPTISSFFGHSRAYIKIQDGCNMSCSYCIIPQVRPIIKSRPPEEILQEVQGLLEKGYYEFVLCGIRLGRYLGFDRFGRRHALSALIEKLASLPGDFRIRLSSLEVSDLTDRFLELYCAMDKTVPYFHIPLESGCDRTLKTMNRWYTTDFYRHRIEACRRFLGNDCAIFTDLIVGFPTETEKDFEESLYFVEAVGFAGVHVFRFSLRPSTPAAKIKPCYSLRDLERRLEKAHQLDRELRERYLSYFIGSFLNVVVEDGDGEYVQARAENFLEVLVPKKLVEARGLLSRLVQRTWQTVKIIGAKEGKLLGILWPP